MENLKLKQELKELRYGGKSPLDAEVSLYDYLGHAAGTELGKDVYKKAMEVNEPVSTRDVETPNYRGKVMLYRKQFLKEYFKMVTDV
tara:strand:+ start:297 stop:557 length:261 start_codon:yes stop_codon:yes gene_type:complete